MSKTQATTDAVPAIHKRYMKAAQVVEKLGISRAGLYEKVAAGVLPRPYKLGSTSLWEDGELDKAMEALRGGQR